MKLILIAMLLFSTCKMPPEPQNLSLPKPEEVERIEYDAPSKFRLHFEKDLLQKLPKFVPIDGTYSNKAAVESGKFILKNGKTIRWMSNDHNSILLYEENAESRKEQLFIIPYKPESTKFQPNPNALKSDVGSNRFKLYILEDLKWDMDNLDRAKQKLDSAFQKKINISEIVIQYDVESVNWLIEKDLKTRQEMSVPIFSLTEAASKRLLPKLDDKKNSYLSAFDDYGFIVTFDDEIVYWGVFSFEFSARWVAFQQISASSENGKLKFSFRKYFKPESAEAVENLKKYFAERQ